MHYGRVITLALALGIGASLLTSCGDDTETLSKQEFVEQANAICQATNDSTESVFDGQTEDPFDDLNRRARDYGLTVCGEEG